MSNKESQEHVEEQLEGKINKIKMEVDVTSLQLRC